MTNDLVEHITKLDIQELRMINGDHIIAEILFEDDDEFTISDAIMIDKMVDGNTFYTEWFPFSDTKYMSLSKKHIIGSTTVGFEYKAMFYRLVITRNVKQNLLKGLAQNPDDIKLLKEISGIEDTPQEESYAGWADQIDTSNVQ